MPDEYSFYECECEHLNRKKLPFRDIFEHMVVTDVGKKYAQTNNLTYVTLGPGGMLADIRILKNLIKKGFHVLTIVCIEPLYQKNIALIQAALDFKLWCKEQKECRIQTYWFISLKEYATACINNHALRGNLCICIDPDDRKMRPYFESASFRKRFNNLMQYAMHKEFSIYYVYATSIHQTLSRHIIKGSSTLIEQKPFIHLTYQSGHTTIEHEKIVAFWGVQPVYPLCTKTHTIQVGKRTLVNAQIACLMLNT